MISPRMELPPLPRPGAVRAGRAEAEAPAFDDAMREQEEPVLQASDEIAIDAPAIANNFSAAPMPLDALIAQMLPQQPVANASSGGPAPLPVVDQPRRAAVNAPAPDLAPVARADVAQRAYPQIDASAPSFDLVLAPARDSETLADSGVVTESRPASETVPEEVTPSRKDDERVAIEAAPLAASTHIAVPRNAAEQPARARRVEPLRTQSPDKGDAIERPALVTAHVASGDVAPEMVLPMPMRQQPAPEQAPQAPVFEASAPEAPAVDPSRSLHPQADALAAPEIRRVVITQVETSNHFPVVADPVRQIASEVARAFETPVAATPMEPQSNLVKTISVQLEPESLGTVTLRMRLSGSNLHVRVEVAEPATLDLIQRERDRLQKSMTSENVSIEPLEIRAASEPSPVQGGDGANDPKQDMNAQGQQARQNGASYGGEPRRENRSESGHGESRHGESRYGDSRQQAQDNDSPRGPVTRGVYL